MFTGIVLGLAAVAAVHDAPGTRRLVLALPAGWGDGLQRGASVAINGVCLTVVEQERDGDGAGTIQVAFVCMEETLQRTTVGALNVGDRVNVERALRIGDEIGGHHVAGHVDVVGHIDQIIASPNNRQVFVRFPEVERRAETAGREQRFRPLLVSKGWIAIDGVSLTVVAVEPDRFSVCLIPETLERTTLGFKEVGASVNLEFDGTAKILVQTIERLVPGLVERYLAERRSG